MKLIFATNNAHKVAEIRSALPAGITILSLQEAGIDREIPEPYDTLEENAGEKSAVISQLTGEDCFSEDTGLETEALRGEPGVKSARYAGEGSTGNENMLKLLGKLSGETNRKARFRTIISLRMQGKETLFEGVCEGAITFEKSGDKGFGYDPIFIPDGADKTFAEMSIEEKNKYSHRKKATEKLVAFLNNLEIK